MIEFKDHLEDFGNVFADIALDASSLNQAEANLSVYETGYQAGWDDAAKALRENGGLGDDADDNSEIVNHMLERLQHCFDEKLTQTATHILETLAPVLSLTQILDAVKSRNIATQELESGIVVTLAPDPYDSFERYSALFDQYKISLMRDENASGEKMDVKIAQTHFSIGLNNTLSEIYDD